MKEIVKVEDLGVIEYGKAWKYQQNIHDQLKENKISDRKNGIENRLPGEHRLLFCEHPHVYTIGKTGSRDHLLLDEDVLTAQNISSYDINRGGDITYHGPGQLVVYPILDLDFFFHDVHRYVRNLEECIIDLLHSYGIKSDRVDKFTGVWLTHLKPMRKICAIGVHLSRWVSMHGLALNVNSDLAMFENIIPCGIIDEDKTVTSMECELGEKVNFKEVKSQFMKSFARVFECEVKS